MPDAFNAIENQWRALATGRNGDAILTRWHQSERALRPYSSLGHLAAAARTMGGSGADLDHRDEVQRALYRLAKSDPDAQLAALWLVSPALRRAAGAYVGIWTFDEAAAVAVTAALDRIVRFPHETLPPCGLHRPLGPPGARTRGHFRPPQPI